MARQFSSIHFLCCSNSVSAMDMAGPLVNELLKLQEGVVVYDSFLECDVMVIAPVICFLADNARASELTNHLGATAVKFCRKCMVCPTVTVEPPYCRHHPNYRGVPVSEVDLDGNTWCLLERVVSLLHS